MGALSLVWTLFIINVSTSVLGDAIIGLGFQIAFYYGLTGFACTVYYRKEIFKSARNFIMVGVAPFLGGAMLTFIFIKALIPYSEPGRNGNRLVVPRGRRPGGDRRRADPDGSRGDGLRQLRLPEVLQAQAGGRRSGDPRGHRGRQSLGDGGLSAEEIA